MTKKIGLLLFSLMLLLPSSASYADGTEALGSPSIKIKSGSGITTGATGLITQPGIINVEVPEGARINQVLLYWEGSMQTADPGDNTIVISNARKSSEVTGRLIGGQTDFSRGGYVSAYRADITKLRMISDGANSLTAEGLFFTRANNGAGIMVIYTDGSGRNQIDIRDGSDLAYYKLAPPLDSTVPQTYSFAPSATDRTAMLNMFFASVSGSASGGGFRPSVIEVTVGGSTNELPNLLDSTSGDEWDEFTIAVDVPAGASTLTVAAYSRDKFNSGNQPASFDWLASALSIQAESDPGRMTGGGSVFTMDDVRVTRGFEIHCDLRAPNNIEVNWPDNRFHMDTLTAAVCTDNPSIDQLPRYAPFDTFTGQGSGKLNGEDGATIRFVFTDAGEPGTDDTAWIRVWAPGDNPDTTDPVLNVEGFLDRGNMQAHEDKQSTI